MSSEVAKRYAEGLLQVAKENGTVQTKKEQALTISQLLMQYPELMDFFNAVQISSEKKKETVQDVFGRQMDIDMVHFLKLLIDKHRIYCLPEILRDFVHMCNDELHIQEAIVYSVRELCPEDMQKIKEVLQKKTGTVIELQNHLDQRLIGGIKIAMDHQITDVSMQNLLNKLKEVLLKGERA